MTKDESLQAWADALGKAFGGTAKVGNGLASRWASESVTITLPSTLTVKVFLEYDDDGWNVVDVLPPCASAVEQLASRLMVEERAVA